MLLRIAVIVVSILFILDGQLLIGLLFLGFSGLLYTLADVCDKLQTLIELQYIDQRERLSATPTKVDINV